MDIQNRSAISSCKNELDIEIDRFRSIKKESAVVRNDMTNQEQRRLQKRLILKKQAHIRKKSNAMKGRRLKAGIFPELGMILEQIFEVEIYTFIFYKNHVIWGEPRLFLFFLAISGSNFLFCSYFLKKER